MQNRTDFLSSTGIAVFGISPVRKTFAAYVKRHLENSGFKVYPVNPLGKEGFFKDIDSIPEKIESAYISTKPENSKKIVENIKSQAVKKIWFQNGSYNDDILALCQQSGIEPYTGCLMMYIPGVGLLHRFHRVIFEFFERVK